MHKGEGSTYTKLIDIKDFPDLGGAPEMLETTTLSDSMQTYIEGIQSLDALEFTANYTKEDYAKLNALKGKNEGYAVYFGEEGTDDWGCYAYAIDKMTGEELQGPKVTIGMAKKEGWFSKTGSKWQTMPQLMLHYRAAAFFQRTYAPEISMGLMTSEEIQDIDDMETPTRSRVRMTTEERIAQMNEAREALRRQQAEDVEVEDVNQPARSGELFQ
jgi:hypothetical protein